LNRYAVIDLGSNTFHLLISDVNNQGLLSEVYRQRAFTFLSDGGIDMIQEHRIVHGLKVLESFKQEINHHKPIQLRVIGTAVLRSASNRMEFISPAEKILGVPIEIIDGNTEADYIYKGITISKELNQDQHLIMDVGGGSTEFILIQDGKKIIAESFKLGVGVLHAMFHKNDPIQPAEIEAISLYIQETLSPFLDQIRKIRIKSLVGASGSFEILESMRMRDVSTSKVSEVSLQEFDELYDKIIPSCEAERLEMPGLPKERVQLIVVGMILKKVVLDLFKPQVILVSPYALKEGILREMV
jgi:exopolyphosphatase/guanosine-5'-triphosphate,3'-diphosphate pyrophosphatase